MAKAFIAAVPLTLTLLVAVVVTVALTPGTFGFQSWPKSQTAPPRENAVVLDTPLARNATGPKAAAKQRYGAAHGAKSVHPAATPARSDGARRTAAPRLVAVRPHSHDVKRGGGSPRTTKDNQHSSSAPSQSPTVPETVAADPTPVASDPLGGPEARPVAPVDPPAQPPVVETPPADDQPKDDEGHGHQHLLPWWLLDGHRHGHREPDPNRDDTNLP